MEKPTPNVVARGRIEEEESEEVCSTDECNDQCQDQNSWIPLETTWDHWILSAVLLPEAERSHKEDTEKERHEHMGGLPRVLVATPLQSCQYD